MLTVAGKPSTQGVVLADFCLYSHFGLIALASRWSLHTPSPSPHRSIFICFLEGCLPRPFQVHSCTLFKDPFKHHPRPPDLKSTCTHTLPSLFPTLFLLTPEPAVSPGQGLSWYLEQHLAHMGLQLTCAERLRPSSPGKEYCPQSFTHRPGTLSKAIVNGHSPCLGLEVTASHPGKDGVSGRESLLHNTGHVKVLSS